MSVSLWIFLIIALLIGGSILNICLKRNEPFRFDGDLDNPEWEEERYWGPM